MDDPHIESRRKLDEEIDRLEAQLVSRRLTRNSLAQLEARIHTLKLARNNLAPVASLHPEVLQEIFHLAHRSSRRYIDTRTPGLTTLTITWVCHHWRELAHQTSSLWNYIDFIDVDWIEAALSRTRGRKLAYCLNLNMDPRIIRAKGDLVRLCLGNLSRIQRLDLVAHDANAPSTIFPEWTPEWLTPAPFLVELSLEAISLPPKAFSAELPCLQSLILMSCTFDWDDMPVPPGLKRFSILFPNESPTIENIMEIYRIIAPTIETLELQKVFHEAIHYDSRKIHHQLDFNKLDYLYLYESDSQMIELLLVQMSMPNCTSMKILVEKWDDHGQAMIRALISSRSLDQWPVSSLEIQVNHRGTTLNIEEDWSEMDDSGAIQFLPPNDILTSVNYEFGTDDAELESNTQRSCFKLHLEFSTGENAAHTIYVLDSLPIHPIKQVILCSGCMLPPAVLNYIGNLGMLHELAVQILDLDEFCAYLEPKATPNLHEINDSDEFTPVPNIIPFLNLQDLRIFNTQQVTLESFRSFKGWLISKKEVGLPLDNLYMNARIRDPLDCSWDSLLVGELVGQLERFW